MTPRAGMASALRRVGGIAAAWACFAAASAAVAPPANAGPPATAPAPAPAPATAPTGAPGERVAATPTAPPSGVPFRARAWPIPGWMRQQMIGVSWRRGCPVALRDLRVMRVRHVTAQGTTAMGELVVHRKVVAQVAAAFGSMYAVGFPIARMDRIDAYGGSDFASIEANNTSAFNCRRESGTGSGRWSMHAYGMAIDINPIQNPFVSPSGRVAHSASRPYVVRTVGRSPLQILADGAAAQAFTALGWAWGGDWTPYQDYQHFALPRSATKGL